MPKKKTKRTYKSRAVNYDQTAKPKSNEEVDIEPMKYELDFGIGGKKLPKNKAKRIQSVSTKLQSINKTRNIINQKCEKTKSGKKTTELCKEQDENEKLNEGSQMEANAEPKKGKGTKRKCGPKETKTTSKRQRTTNYGGSKETNETESKIKVDKKSNDIKKRESEVDKAKQRYDTDTETKSGVNAKSKKEFDKKKNEQEGGETKQKKESETGTKCKVNQKHKRHVGIKTREEKVDKAKQKNETETETDSEVDENDKGKSETNKRDPKGEEIKKGNKTEPETESDIDEKNTRRIEKKIEQKGEKANQNNEKETECEIQTVKKQNRRKGRKMKEQKGDFNKQENDTETKTDSEVDLTDTRPIETGTETKSEVYLKYKKQSHKKKIKQTEKRKKETNDKDTPIEVHVKNKRKSDNTKKGKDDKTQQSNETESETENIVDVKNKRQTDNKKSKEKETKASEKEINVDRNSTRRSHTNRKQQTGIKIERNYETDTDSEVEVNYKGHADKNKKRLNDANTKHAIVIETDTESEFDEKYKRHSDKKKKRRKYEKTKQAIVIETDTESEVDFKNKRKSDRKEKEQKGYKNKHANETEIDTDNEDNNNDKRQSWKYKEEQKDDKFKQKHEPEIEIESEVENESKSRTSGKKKDQNEDKHKRTKATESEHESDVDIQHKRQNYKKKEKKNENAAYETNGPETETESEDDIKEKRHSVTEKMTHKSYKTKLTNDTDTDIESQIDIKEMENNDRNKPKKTNATKTELGYDCNRKANRQSDKKKGQRDNKTKEKNEKDTDLESNFDRKETRKGDGRKQEETNETETELESDFDWKKKRGSDKKKSEQIYNTTKETNKTETDSEMRKGDRNEQVETDETETEHESDFFDSKEKRQSDKRKYQQTDNNTKASNHTVTDPENDFDVKEMKKGDRKRREKPKETETELESDFDIREKIQTDKMKRQQTNNKTKETNETDTDLDSDFEVRKRRTGDRKKHEEDYDQPKETNETETELESDFGMKEKRQRENKRQRDNKDTNETNEADSDLESDFDMKEMRKGDRKKHVETDETETDYENDSFERKEKRQSDKRKNEEPDNYTKETNHTDTDLESDLDMKEMRKGDRKQREKTKETETELESDFDMREKRQTDEKKRPQTNNKTKETNETDTDLDSDFDLRKMRKGDRTKQEENFNQTKEKNDTETELESDFGMKEKRQRENKRKGQTDNYTKETNESESDTESVFATSDRRKNDKMNKEQKGYKTKKAYETESENEFQSEKRSHETGKQRTSSKAKYDMGYGNKGRNTRKTEYRDETEDDDDNDRKNESDSEDIIKNLNKNHQFYVTFTRAEWLEYKPKDDQDNVDKLKLASGWTDLICEKINLVIPTCPLKVSSHNISKMARRDSRYLTGTVLCKNEGCSKFSIQIREEPSEDSKVIKIKVNLIRPIRCHEVGKVDPKKRKLTGKRRSKLKESLKKSTASNVHYSEYGEMKGEEIKFGNYTKCQTEEIFRKLKSESNKDDLMHPDPFTELVIVKEVFDHVAKHDGDEWGYIKEIDYVPFMVTMYTPLSIEVAKKAIAKGDGVFHFDATGSVLKKLSKRKIFYYALVVKKVDNKTASVPVLEFVSDHHGTFYVCRPLQLYFSLLGKHQPVRIVVDFSWALIHSVLISVNIMDIHTYLRACFEVARGEREKSFTAVYLCSTHMLKAVRDNLRDRVKEKALRHIALRVFALMQNVTNIHQSVTLWKLWCVVFGSREVTAHVQASTDEFLNIIKKADIDALDTDLVCDTEKGSEDELPEVKRKGPIREQSPFRPIYQKYVPDQDYSVTITNKYYNIEVLDMMTSNYLPLIPLWSGMILEDDTRDNNAPVESWMGVLKNSVLQKERSLRLAKFVWMINPVLKGRLKKHQQHQKTSEQPRKKAKFDDDEADMAEEGWTPKRGRSAGPTKGPKGVYHETKDLPEPKGHTKRDNTKEKHKPAARKPRFSSKRIVPGLVNVRNTCWLNSALQCFASLPGFMLEGHHPLPSAVQDVLIMIRTATFSGLDTINPEDLRDIIETELEDMPLGEEHDSAHFISELMAKNAPSKTGFEFKIQSTRICLRCDRQRIALEDANILTIEIPRRDIIDSPSIVDCLREFEKEEVLTLEGGNAPRCHTCETNTNTLSSLKCTHVRKGLIIQLKRQILSMPGSGRQRIRKDSNPVRLNRFVTISGFGFYRLYGVILVYSNDSGAKCTLLAPTYLVFTLDKDWTIHKCNDSVVEEVESSVLLTNDVEKNCYILCYEEVTENCVKNLMKCYDERGKQSKKDQNKQSKREIINAYFSLVTKTNPNVAAMDVFFFLDVVKKKDLSRWLKPELFEKHMLLIPAIYQNHWRLVVWDLLNSSVETYDSGHAENDVIQPFIQQIINQKECPGGRQAIRVKKNLPKQRNTYDCGVFVCMFAKQVALRQEITFTADEMQQFRRTIALEVLGENLM